ncbi:MAG: SseB family protein [Clostridium sp.]|nr:SseB family protein [Clostridium sp.]
MNKERKNEIGIKFIYGYGEREELSDLRIEEIIFLLYSIKNLIENKEDDGILHSDLKITIFTEVLIEKIKNLECIYIISNNRTRYPLIDGNTAYIFTKEELATNAINLLQNSYGLDLQIHNFYKKDYKSLVECLYVLGIENLLINEGQYKDTISVESIFGPQNFTELPEKDIPLTNPYLQLNLILFTQYLEDYNKDTDRDKKILDALYKRILNSIYDSKFLMPVILNSEDSDCASFNRTSFDEIILKKDTQFILGTLTNENTNTSWIAVFTDWIEFRKKYGNNDDWKGNIVTIEDLIELSAKMDGIVINCDGTAFTVGKDVMEVFKKTKEKEKEKEEVYPVTEHELNRDHKNYIFTKTICKDETTYFLKDISCENGIVGIKYDRSILKEVNTKVSLKDVLKPKYIKLNIYKIITLIPIVVILGYFIYQGFIPETGYSFMLLLGFILAPVNIVFKKSGKAWAYFGVIIKSLQDIYIYIIELIEKNHQLIDIILIGLFTILVLISASWHIKLLFKNIGLIKIINKFKLEEEGMMN